MSNVTTNTSSSAGGDPKYGINIDDTNANNKLTFGYEDIIMTARSGEGVFSGQVDGIDKFYTSRQIIKVLDLICEGEIDGIVSGEYVPEGENPVGQVGYTSRPFTPFAPNPEGFLRSIYLNDTPVVNKNNQYNFQQLETAIFNGAPEGIEEGDDFLYVGDKNTLEKSRIINERLYGPDIDPNTGAGGNADSPFFYHSKIYRILNPYLSKVRTNIKINSLSIVKQGEDFDLEEIGETVGSQLTFKYRYRPIYQDTSGLMDLNTSRQWYGDGGINNPGVPLTSRVTGLVRSAFIHRFEMEFADELKTDELVGWEIEITRITVDSIQSNMLNETFIDSFTELHEDTYSYPHSAIVSMNFNAEFFSQIPNRAYDLRLLKVKVPTGYDPITKQYEVDEDDLPVPWKGTFQSDKQWTDNPAWIFYDLLTNKRYGLAKHFGFNTEETEIDKWTLYEISRFCDVLVNDGEGNVEPRFTCNTLINTREDAYKVLRDFASCFRAIVYYGLGSIRPVQDKPRAEIAQFANANVENGDFYYSSSPGLSRPSVCLVRYNDSADFFKPAIEYVEDTEAIRKYGVIEKEITAFACTSRSQAIRVGRWLLATESSQSEVVSFTVGPEGMLLRPGDVVRVADENRSISMRGGRVQGYSYHTDGYHVSGILLDRVIEDDQDKSYTMVLTTPSYFYDTSVVKTEGWPYDEFRSDDATDIRKPQVQVFNWAASSPTVESTNIKIGDSVTGDIHGTYITYTATNPDGTEDWMFESSTKSGIVVEEATWSIMDNDYSNSLFSVISAKEDQPNKYKIQALVHEPRKYDFIEAGIPYSFVPYEVNVTVAPPPPDEPLGLDVIPYDDEADTNTKKIQITIDKPDDLGTTIGYKIYIKEGTQFTPGDTLSPSVDVPKPEFLWQTIFLTDYTDPQSENPRTWYIPPRNAEYFFRVYAVNSTSVMSNGKVDGQITVTNHYPVKDIKIHSLRLQTTATLNNEMKDPARKTFFGNLDNKDFAIEWEATFLKENVITIPIRYQVSIHTANVDSSTPIVNEDGEGLDSFITAVKHFNYTFDLNRTTNGGPRRHVDIVVQAIDEEGISSAVTPMVGLQGEGWDILEVYNPKPKDFHLTPRKDNGKRPGDYICCDNECEVFNTEQYIDADGNVVLKLFHNSFPDLAGGYLYLSKHPFSGDDFKENGEPKQYSLGERPHIAVADWEKFKESEFEILEVPFEAATPGQTLASPITVSPPSQADEASEIFDYSSAYYMAAKLYDSFDREIKTQALDPDWNDDAWIGFARDHEETRGDGNTLMAKYSFSSLSEGYYAGVYSHGEPSCEKATFACPIWPTKYFSSNETPFKYWIRINVNGQWEGNGISHIRALTHKDVQTYYNYQGYFEYSCYMTEQVEGKFDQWIMPNALNSITRCRFRQGQLIGNGPDIMNVDHSDIYYGPWPPAGQGDAYVFVTGASRPPDGYDPNLTDRPLDWQRKWQPLPRAGIPYGGWGRTYTQVGDDTAGARPDVDKIPSYNWRGAAIENKSRPLYGFRRFRVYFDPKNLPPRSEKDQLSAYSIVGLNSWNGAYEGWPGDNAADIKKSILTAKDEVPAADAWSAGTYPTTVRTWIKQGDLFENIPGVWNHHSAGFGAGFGGLIKEEGWFDVHMGRLIDDSYLNEAFFGVVHTNDYSILDSTVVPADNFDQQTELHEGTWSTIAYVSSTDNDGPDPYPSDD